MVARLKWVLLAYRLPREPSTPRIAVWRSLRRLGAAQLVDGLVAMPADARTIEALEWLADDVAAAGGEASVWVAEPTSGAQERALATRMAEMVTAEYIALADDARTALVEDPGVRRRALARLRRELRRVGARDYFPPPERDVARDAIEALTASLEPVR